MAEDTSESYNTVAEIEQPSLFKITRSQKERMDRNKMKAKALKHSRLTSQHHPYKRREPGISKGEGTQNMSSSASGGGYMLDTVDSDVPKTEYKLVEDEGTASICTVISDP